MAKKILLADDSITIQKVISITFASENYELIIVGDGESAIKRAKEARPDLIMADVAMPGKTGYEVCEAIKNDSSLSSTPVMLLAGTFEPLDMAEAERVRADDSIVKPFESQELLDKVSGLLGSAPEREGASHAESPGVPTPPAPEGADEGFAAPESWGDGDFIGFPEEMQEKPAFKGADQLPDIDFLDNGGLFEEPEKDLSQGEGFTDLEFNEAEGLEPNETFAPPAPYLKYDTVDEAVVEPEAAAQTPSEGQEPPSEAAGEDAGEAAGELADEDASQAMAGTETPSKPFWAENVSRDDNFGEPKDISEFPDLYDEGAEAPAEDAGRTPEVEVPVEKPEPAPADEGGETPYGAASFERAAPAPEPPFEHTAQHEETIEAPEPFEPAPVVGMAEEAVVEKTIERLQHIEVPREELEEAVRKAVRDVVQEIAWEVVPELAEELIKAEIDKVKEALTRLK